MPVVLKRFKAGQVQPRDSVGYYSDLPRNAVPAYYPVHAKTKEEWMDKYRWAYDQGTETFSEDAWVYLWEDDNPEWGEECP